RADAGAQGTRALLQEAAAGIGRDQHGDRANGGERWPGRVAAELADGGDRARSATHCREEGIGREVTSKQHKSPAREKFESGLEWTGGHPLFGTMLSRAKVVRSEDKPYPREGWAYVTPNGTIYVHPHRLAEPEVWLYCLAHCLLHLGFGHL